MFLQHNFENVTPGMNKLFSVNKRHVLFFFFQLNHLHMLLYDVWCCLLTSFFNWMFVSCEQRLLLLQETN